MLRLTTAPTDPIVSLDQLKRHLAIEHDLDDERLELLLEAASAFVEREADQAFTSQGWTQTQACFTKPLIVQKTPITSVSVKYRDTNNVEQTLSGGSYYIIRSSVDCRLLPVSGVWPETYGRPDAVTVLVTCGASPMPPEAKQACLMLAAHWNENREAEVQGSTTEIKIGFDRLIRSLRKGFIC
jgi:uncharacterized phiE125 gp8 family phage protein